MRSKAIVVGGSRGFGMNIVEELAIRGCDIGIISRTYTDMFALKKYIIEPYGVDVFIEVADISDENENKRAILSLIEQLRGVDICIFNAVYTNRYDIVEIDDVDILSENLRKSLNTNVISVLDGIQYVCAYARNNKSPLKIGIVSSHAIRSHTPWQVSLVISKDAVNTYVCMTREWLRKYNITITMFFPGYLEQTKHLFHAKPCKMDVRVSAKWFIDDVYNSVDISHTRSLFWKLHYIFAPYYPMDFLSNFFDSPTHMANTIEMIVKQLKKM
jgi:short-subunit dehydrogenase